MEKKIINFKASGQSLQRVGGIVTAASDTVNYFEAHFELDEGWLEFAAVRAIWSNGIKNVPSVLNHGACKIPSDVLADVSKLKVNLVGSVSENGVLTDRLTTFLCPAFGVTVKVPVDGTDPEEIPASQIEQFVEVVKEDADRAERSATASAQSASASQGYASDSAQSAQNASTSEDNAKVSELNAEAYKNQAQASAESAFNSADEAEEWADKAEQSAEDAGYMEFHIDEYGHLIYERTSNVDHIDFSISNGHLIMEVA